MKVYRKIFIFLTCLLILTIALPMDAFAAGPIDFEKDVTLKINYVHEGQKISSADFDIYCVAKVGVDGEITPVDSFSMFDMDIYGSNDAKWRELAQSLEKYINENKVVPYDYGTTDPNGVLEFPNYMDKLEQGIYLVVGHPLTKGNINYSSSTFLISLPQTDSNDDWVYDVVATPKVDDNEIAEPVKPTPEGPRLPQTGQLWWPVPILILLGVIFITLGVLCQRGTKNEK